MNTDTLRKIIGFIVFMITTVVYFLTVQPNVSFWDCGEFIASSDLLQVPHPPGTPFFLILGRLFAMLPFGKYNFSNVECFCSSLSLPSCCESNRKL